MALTSSAAARYGTQFLINLTNPFNTSATTIDNTRLLNAADDAEGRFQTVVGVAYDETNKSHVGVAVTGVHCFLLKRSGKAGAITEQVCGEFEERLEELSKSAGVHARLVPQTTSDLTPSQEVPTGNTVRPDFDLDHFDDIMPEPPT